MYELELIETYIINKNISLNKAINGRVLEGLMFYSQALSLIKKGKALFPNEFIKKRTGAGNYSLRRFRSSQIYFTKKEFFYPVVEIDENLTISFGEKEYCEDDIKKEDRELLDKVIKSYLSYDEWDIAQKIHQEDVWIDICEGEAIKEERIKEYYQKNQELILGKDK